MTRIWVPVVSVLLLFSLIINAEVIYQNRIQNSQMKYAESYGMDHVVANIQAADSFMNKDREYSATQIAEAAGELVTLSKIIPIDSSNTRNYAWKIGYYLHAQTRCCPLIPQMGTTMCRTFLKTSQVSVK